LDGEGAGAGFGAGLVRDVAKIVPVDGAGRISLGLEKTNGEKLAEQLFQVASDPTYKPNTDVSSEEVSSGLAGPLSQFLWGILYVPSFSLGTGEGQKTDLEPVDVIVAPNLLTGWRQSSGAECVTARVVRLDLAAPGACKERPVGSQVFVCSTRIPRTEMRTFIEQCQEPVFTTGDQSLSEAIFLGKNPCIRPDAKVQQWERAAALRQAGALAEVPDLGAVLRQLLVDAAARERARQLSRLSSEATERGMVAQLGPPNLWSPTHWVLAKAGMMG